MKLIKKIVSTVQPLKYKYLEKKVKLKKLEKESLDLKRDKSLKSCEKGEIICEWVKNIIVRKLFTKKKQRAKKLNMEIIEIMQTISNNSDLKEYQFETFFYLNSAIGKIDKIDKVKFTFGLIEKLVQLNSDKSRYFEFITQLLEIKQRFSPESEDDDSFKPTIQTMMKNNLLDAVLECVVLGFIKQDKDVYILRLGEYILKDYWISIDLKTDLFDLVISFFAEKINPKYEKVLEDLHWMKDEKETINNYIINDIMKAFINLSIQNRTEERIVNLCRISKENSSEDDIAEKSIFFIIKEYICYKYENGNLDEFDKFIDKMEKKNSKNVPRKSLLSSRPSFKVGGSQRVSLLSQRMSFSVNSNDRNTLEKEINLRLKEIGDDHFSDSKEEETKFQEKIFEIKIEIYHAQFINSADYKDKVWGAEKIIDLIFEELEWRRCVVDDKMLEATDFTQKNLGLLAAVVECLLSRKYVFKDETKLQSAFKLLSKDEKVELLLRELKKQKEKNIEEYFRGKDFLGVNLSGVINSDILKKKETSKKQFVLRPSTVSMFQERIQAEKERSSKDQSKVLKTKKVVKEDDTESKRSFVFNRSSNPVDFGFSANTVFLPSDEEGDSGESSDDDTANEGE